eukprot:215682-Chlamydomonas_euryale.AAC.3
MCATGRTVGVHVRNRTDGGLGLLDRVRPHNKAFCVCGRPALAQTLGPPATPPAALTFSSGTAAQGLYVLRVELQGQGWE